MIQRIVIIPTYNEIENIRQIIQAVFHLSMDFHVLIVDDGSPDGTAAAVKSMQQEFSERLFLEERSGKGGLGTAYIHGFKWCLARNYTHIFEMDADFSHPVKDLENLYKACEQGADLSVGSRYKKGINVVNWPLHRILISYGASIYVKLITGMRVQDPTAGFVCYTRKVLEAIPLDRVKFVGYAFQIEMKFRAHVLGFKIEEVPIVFKDRERGKSKMSADIVGEAILGVLKLKWQSMFNHKNF